MIHYQSVIAPPPYSADLAISARWDLNPVNGTYPIPPLGHGRIGGLDVKVRIALHTAVIYFMDPIQK